MLYTYNAVVTDVYDGDSITLSVDLGFKVNFSIKVRLSGINTPEIRGASRPEGLIARDYLRDLILDKKVIFKSIKDKKGKYGRYLGIIYIDGANINKKLLDLGLAEKY